MTKRIAVLGFMLESNKFSPVTREEDYRKRCYLVGDEITAELAKDNPKVPLEILGFQQELADRGIEWEMVPVVLADAEPGGPIDQAFFDATLATMEKLLSAAGPLDGVYIASHGAMRATDDWDPDATLYKMVRGLIGDDVPLIATLDLHANVSDAMVETADLLIAYRTNPHVDQRERAAEAAAAMCEMWEGMVPHSIHIKTPIAAPTITLLTAEGPYADLINFGQAQKGPDILNVTITAGFIYSDSPKCGLSIVVSSREDGAAARKLATEIATKAWAEHERYRKSMTSLQSATEKALMNGHNPAAPALIMADCADNPGGGGTGATTYILKAFTGVNAKGAFIGLIVDRHVAADAHAAGEGATMTARFNEDPQSEFDEPLAVPVTVEKLTNGTFVGRRGYLRGRKIDLGPCALLRAGNVLIGVTSNRKQTADPAMIEQFGINIADLRTVVVKSRGHFRAGFDEFFPPERILEIDCPGLVSPILSNFDWQQLPRPSFPLDEETTWSVPSLSS